MALMEFDPDKAYQDVCEAYTQVCSMVDLNLSASYASVAKMAAGWSDLNNWMRAGGRPPAAWAPLSKIPGGSA